MTFTTDDTCTIKIEYSDEEISAILAESKQERKRLRKLGKVMETVAAYRLKGVKHFQAMEKMATWRRTYGYDRDDSWMYAPRPLAPEELTDSLWGEVNTLKKAISMSDRARPWQKANTFLDGLEQGKRASRMHNLPCSNGSWRGEAAMRHMRLLRRLIQHSTVAPARMLPKHRSIHVSVWIWGKYEVGRMNPEPTELESPSAVTGLETSGQQCLPNGETGRTTADGYLLVGMGSNQGGDTSSPTERVDTRADSKITTAPTASNTTLLQARRKPNDKKTLSKENKQFDPGGKRGEPPPGNAGCTNSVFFFWGEL